MMTLTTHGIREGSKADLPGEEKAKEKAEKEKEKAEEDEDSSGQEGKEKEKEKEREEKEEPTWWVKKTMKMNDKRQKIGMRQMTAIGPMTRHGKKGIGPMKIYITRMSMDTSRRKEKEKARKERMMKEKESQEMEKENPTMFNLRHHPILQQFNSNKLNTPQQLQVHQHMVFLSLVELNLLE
eukprot:s156_g26.t1